MLTIQAAAIIAEVFGYEVVANADRRVMEVYCEGFLIWEAEWK